MDSLSYRKARSSHAENEPSPATVADSVEFEPPVTRTAPQPHRQSSAHHRGQKKETSGLKKWLSIVGLLAGLALIAGLVLTMFGVLGGGTNKAVAPMVDTGKYQAVFLTNGQVYFGKLTQAGGNYLQLTNVFYLQKKASADQKKENPQEAQAQTANDVELVKLGNEIHGPEDMMLIQHDQVLFYENLKADGNVAKTISQYQSQKK